MTRAYAYAFGPYLFTPSRQLLRKDGKRVRIGCRALDLLSAFVRRPGEVLGKSALMKEAWPHTTVVEGNLKVHIAALRRALSDDADEATYIGTVIGQGYRFIAPVVTLEGSDATPDTAHPHADAALPPVAVLDARFRDLVALLAQTMRSAIIDLPADTQPSSHPEMPRRLLCIELGAQDDAWIENMFARGRDALPATL